MPRSRILFELNNPVPKNDEISVDQQFLSDLKASIEKESSKDVHVASTTYKPSSMQCIRNMFFQILGYEPESSNMGAELVGICDSGTDRHIRIQDAIKRMQDNGYDCQYVDVSEYVKIRGLTDLQVKSKNGNETKLYNKRLNISFLCDGIIRYKDKYYIIEIKTETSSKYWEQRGVMPGHMIQGVTYSLCLGLENVIFIYENRDNCAKKTFLFHVTDEMRAAVEEKIKTCDSYVAKKELPPKPSNVTRKDCSYCAYSKYCKEDKHGTK